MRRTRPTALLVSVNACLRKEDGSKRYLTQIIDTMRALGWRVAFLDLSDVSATRRRVRLNRAALACVDDVVLPDTVRIGAWRYATSPWVWLGRAARRPAPGAGSAAAPAPVETVGSWRFAPAAEAGRRALSRTAAQLRPALVIGNYFNAAEAFDALPPATPTLVVTHDVLALRARSLAAMGRAPDFEADAEAREAAAFRGAGLCLTIKPDEADHVRELGGRAAVFPFCMDPVVADLDTPRAPVALFVGADNGPNADGLAWLLAEVWPQVRAARRDARLRVVGRVVETAPPPPSGVELVGPVDALAPEYARAAASLTPLRYGSGLKIKLIEGLAHGAPGVATTVGADGVPPAPPAALRVADEAQDFAAAILAVFDDPDPSTARRAAQAHVAAHFGLAAAKARMTSILETLTL